MKIQSLNKHPEFASRFLRRNVSWKHTNFRNVIFECGLTILTLITVIVLTGCSQVETFVNDFGVIPSITPTPGPTAIPTKIPPSATPTEILPSPTETASPLPTLTLTPKPTRTPRPTYTASPTVGPLIRVGPDNFPDYINPLTGLPVANPTLLERRPIAVKVPNYPHYVRPQSGLSLADQIYEYYLEGGLTRFIAIFYGNDAARVGPIRSGRNFDAHIAQMYNAVYVFNGAYHEEEVESLDVYGYLEDNYNVNLFVVDPGKCTPYMCRDETIDNYNNLFGNTAEISKLITERGVSNKRPDLASNFFYSLGGYSTEWGTLVRINYSYAEYAYWEFDTSRARYQRYQGNVDLLNGQEPSYDLLSDAYTGLPILVDNIVILYVPHAFYHKSTDGEIFDIQLEGEGRAYIFRDGRGYEASWVREEKNKPFALMTTSGNPFPLKPGVTFFQVMNDTTILNREGQTWEFNFVRPEE